MTYTFDKNPAAEKRIALQQQLIVENVLRYIPESALAAIVLIGGYGRAEGGYVLNSYGQPAPFNDYDYFLIFRGVSKRRADQLTKKLPILDDLVGIEVDFHPLRLEELADLQPSLMFAEMQQGHKVVYGDKQVLTAMPSMPLCDLPLSEFTRLMINRGCLLLMNFTNPQAITFTRYVNKAALAAGDTILAMHDRYHPGYKVKVRRLADVLGTRHPLYLRYAQAVSARFRPDTGAVAQQRDLVEMTRIWLETLQRLEELRLNEPVVSWDRYCDPAVHKQQDSGSWVKHFLLNLRDRKLGMLKDSLRWYKRHPRERIVSALPALLSNRTCAIDAVHGTLAIADSSNWKVSADKLLELWGRYS